MEIFYLKAALICLLIVLGSPLIVETGSASMPSQGLGFANQTGSNTSVEQVSAFINFINSASTYFREDHKAKLEYISNQMNASYGVDGYGYSVI